MTPLVTSLALLVHILVGCCWHHAHAAPSADMVTSGHVCVHHLCSHDTGEPTSDSQGTPARPDHDSSCDEMRCVVIQSVPAAVIPPWDLPPVAGGDLPTAQIGAWPLAWLSLFPDDEAAFGPSRTPVTLHQLLRI